MHKATSYYVLDYLVIGTFIVTGGQVFDLMNVRMLKAKAETLF